MSLPLSDRIASLKAKKEQLAVKLTSLEAKARQEDRKRDTRRKIVVGAAVLAALDKEPGLAVLVRKVLAAGVTRENDRGVVADLLGSDAAAVSGGKRG